MECSKRLELLLSMMEHADELKHLSCDEKIVTNVVNAQTETEGLVPFSTDSPRSNRVLLWLESCLRWTSEQEDRAGHWYQYEFWTSNLLGLEVFFHCRMTQLMEMFHKPRESTYLSQNLKIMQKN